MDPMGNPFMFQSPPTSNPTPMVKSRAIHWPHPYARGRTVGGALINSGLFDLVGISSPSNSEMMLEHVTLW